MSARTPTSSSRAPAPGAAEPRALYSMFEGLFVRGLRVDPPLKTRLKACGFDLDAPRPSYPMQVWEDAVDAAVASLYPGLTRSEGWRHIGRTFIEGYFQTLVGKLVTVGLGFLSPTAFINRGPRFVSTGTEGVVATITWVDAKHAVMDIVGGADESGALMAGVIEVCFQRMKQPAPTFEWTSERRHSVLRIALA